MGTTKKGENLKGKGLFVILDGLGDLPCATLDGATPLEAAATPIMDGLLTDGRCGLVDPLAPGVTVDTQTGTAMLFGVAPDDVARIARGPVEAAGVGLELSPGDVALRCNFATLADGAETATILDRRAGRIREGTERLADALNTLAPHDGVSATFRAASQHRCVLRLRGAGLSAAITNTDPGPGAREKRRQLCRALESGDRAAERTARAVNDILQRAGAVLGAHEVNTARGKAGRAAANGLLTRGAGLVQPVQSIVTALGLSGAVVAAESTVLGLAALLGFERIVRPGFTAMPDTDVDGKVAAAVAALKTHDLVWLHFKGTDTTAHDRDPEAKRRFLERVDAALAPLGAVPDLRLAISADHSTDSTSGCHTADPVPSLLRGPAQRADACRTFSERNCRDGALGRLPAATLVAIWLGDVQTAAVRTGRPPEAALYPRSRE